MNKGLLIVVSAPSGAGKGTILTEILKDENFYYSISATTRTPRPTEENGVNYHFITKENFEELIAENGMLEYASYCGNYYGTPKKEVEEKLNEGKDVILEIEVQGAMKIKELCPDAIFIFIAPPSIKELEIRLNNRGTEEQNIINERVSKALEEIKFVDRYDYIVVNDEISKAIDDFKIVVKACKMQTKYSKDLIEGVLNNA